MMRTWRSSTPAALLTARHSIDWQAIGEALNENGKVIVTGCLGAKRSVSGEVHPKVLEITGPHSYRAGSGARSSLRAKTETQPIPEPGARTRCETDAASLCLSENF